MPLGFFDAAGEYFMKDAIAAIDVYKKEQASRIQYHWRCKLCGYECITYRKAEPDHRCYSDGSGAAAPYRIQPFD